MSKIAKMEPSLETDTLLDVATLWEKVSQDCGWESVMVVQEKCDEKSGMG
jgi:hypothetical protein